MIFDQLCELEILLFSQFLETLGSISSIRALAGQATTSNPSTTPSTCHESHTICCVVSSDG